MSFSVDDLIALTKKLELQYEAVSKWDMSKKAYSKLLRSCSIYQRIGRKIKKQTKKENFG